MPDTDKPRRGRPRPEDAIERDEQIKTLLNERGPLTRNEIAGELGISYSLVYLALARLREQGDVKRCLQEGVSVWSTATSEPCE